MQQKQPNMFTTDSHYRYNNWEMIYRPCSYPYSLIVSKQTAVALFLSTRIQLSSCTVAGFKTQSCCFQPVSFLTERKVIEFCLLYRGSSGWIKIFCAWGYTVVCSGGEWCPIMALKRKTCIINHLFLFLYPWHVRQENLCLSEHRQ